MARRLLREYGDAALAFALLAVSQLEIWFDPDFREHITTLLPISFTATVVLLWRRSLPLLALAVNGVGFGFVDSLDLFNDPMGLVLALLVSIYSTGAYTRGRTAVVGGLLVAALATRALLSEPMPIRLDDVLFYATIAGGPWVAGRAISRRRVREQHLIVEREEQARAAVLEERTRIARELHDVVAHAISVIVLQARGARHEFDAEPANARAAIDAIERTASQALAEMRRLLAMLRADDESVPMAPQPTLAHVDTLVAQVRGAGLPVDVRVEGERRELPPGVDVTAYRIVQEALTNALKHAGPARARVLMRYDPDALTVVVADTGAGVANGSAGGHGLAGMRERVAVFGGELESGPGTDGGFEVRARLPL